MLDKPHGIHQPCFSRNRTAAYRADRFHEGSVSDKNGAPATTTAYYVGDTRLTIKAESAVAFGGCESESKFLSLASARKNPTRRQVKRGKSRVGTESDVTFPSLQWRPHLSLSIYIGCFIYHLSHKTPLSFLKPQTSSAPGSIRSHRRHVFEKADEWNH
jgi:hypothetical protein